MSEEYKNMNVKELWQEILALIGSTHFSDVDKGLFLQLIQEYSFKCQRDSNEN